MLFKMCHGLLKERNFELKLFIKALGSNFIQQVLEYQNTCDVTQPVVPAAFPMVLVGDEFMCLVSGLIAWLPLILLHTGLLQP